MPGPDMADKGGIPNERPKTMVNRKTLAPALLSALVISAPVMAVAQQTTRPAAAEPEVKAEQASKAQLKAFEAAKVRLAGAIAAAEKHAGGGKVIDVLFDAGVGKPHYKVKTYQNNAVWEGTVDAASGQVIGAGTTTPE